MFIAMSIFHCYDHCKAASVVRSRKQIRSCAYQDEKLVGRLNKMKREVSQSLNKSWWIRCVCVWVQVWAGLRASGKGTAILLQEDRVLPCVGGSLRAKAQGPGLHVLQRKSWRNMMESSAGFRCWVVLNLILSNLDLFCQQWVPVEGLEQWVDIWSVLRMWLEEIWREGLTGEK